LIVFVIFGLGIKVNFNPVSIAAVAVISIKLYWNLEKGQKVIPPPA